MIESHRMTWEAFQKMIRSRLEDDDVEDEDLVLTRAETATLLGWGEHFYRKGKPRRDEEERAYKIIRDAAALLQSKQ